MEYIAFIHKEDDSFVATVPDLNNISSFGETFAQTVHMIIEACELYCEDLDTLPKASTYEELAVSEDIQDGAIPQLIDIKVEKNIRVNVMMRSDILKAADERAKELFSGNRSAYLQDLVKRDTL